MNQELSDVQGGFRKVRKIRDQIVNIFWDHRKSKGIPEKQKTSTSALLTMLKPLPV